MHVYCLKGWYLVNKKTAQCPIRQYLQSAGCDDFQGMVVKWRFLCRGSVDFFTARGDQITFICETAPAFPIPL